jgi:transcriptional regulator with XRE-family HTH domain
MTNTEFKTIRKSLNLTQAQFADILGKSRRRIQSYEHGASKYRKNEIPTIVEHFLKLVVKERFISLYGEPVEKVIRIMDDAKKVREFLNEI